MTCIVGIEQDGVVYMGGDSAAVGGWQGMSTSIPKVFRVGGLLFGYTSSFRMGQIIQHHLTPPAHDDGNSPIEYLVKQLIPEIRRLFSAHGYMGKDAERENGGVFLVGYRGELYRVDADFQVIRYCSGFAAVGSGEEYALGVLFHTAGDKPLDRMRDALKAAEFFCIGVMGPFVFETLGKVES